ncbi:MAG TPA: hypothetical protein PLI97_11590, partial [Fluviicola sp.]|nr:hypothetical protein [Fluviicola sp.]
CTVTKRHYSKGFYVEWQRKYHAKSKIAQTYEDTTSRQLASVSKEMLVESKNLNTNNNASEPFFETYASLTCSQHEQKVGNPRNYKHLSQKLDEMKQKIDTFNHVKKEHFLHQKLDTEKPKEEPRVELFTWITIGIIGVSLLFLMLLIFSDFLLSLEFYSILLVVLAILYVISSITSIIRILKNPKNYKAKWLNWMFFGFALLILASLLLAFISDYI